MKRALFFIILMALGSMLIAQAGHTLDNPLRGYAYTFSGSNGSDRYLLAKSTTTGSSIWGDGEASPYYTDDSDPDTMLRHWHGTSTGTRKIMQVTIRPGGSNYLARLRNGVQSNSWASWSGSVQPVQTYDLTAPSISPGNFSVTNRTTTSVTINWTRGNGHRVLVFMRQGGSSSGAPMDYSTYYASTAFGNGTAGSNNTYCVYNGTGTSVTVTNLVAGTTYGVNILEYKYPYDDFQVYESGGLYSHDFTTLSGVSFTGGNAYIPSPSPALGSTNQVLGRFALQANTTGASLTNASIRLNGIRSGLSNFMLWYSTNDMFGSGSQLGLSVASDPTDGHSVNFSFTQALDTSIGYYFLTCDIAPDAQGSIQPVVTENSSLSIITGALTTTINNAPLSAVPTMLLPYPVATASISPANGVNGIDNPPNLSWLAPAGGCTGYKIYLGTDYPPTNILTGQLHAGTSYSPSVLQYNTLHYWQIVPYNSTGNATDTDIWSFTTTDTYSVAAPVVVVGEDIITPQIEIPSISGEFAPSVSTSWNPPGTPYQNVGLQIVISGVNLAGRLVVINPDMGFIPTGLAYRIQPSATWNYVPTEGDWRVDYAYFTVSGAKADGDLEIVFPNSGDITLPVELSSFTAIYYSQNNYVLLSWVTQSETDHLGYNILRSESGTLQNALRINGSLISTGQSMGTVTTYQFQDLEVYSSITYHYWLESISLNGIPHYYGPIVQSVETLDEGAPDIPLTTKLIGAYPNPFNPSTTISFAITKPERVSIVIFNLRGQEVKSFEQDYSVPGNYSINWDGRDNAQRALGSGVYYYRMTAGRYHGIKKMILSK